MNAFNSGFKKGFDAGADAFASESSNQMIKFAQLLIQNLEFKNAVMKNNCNIDNLDIFAECKELQDILK